MYVDHQGEKAGKVLKNVILLIVIGVIGVCIYFVYDKVQNGLFHNGATQQNVCKNAEGVETMEKSGLSGATKCEPEEKDAKTKIREVYGK